MSEVQNIADGLQNVVANLGTARDKAAHTTYSATMMSASELFNLYSGSWLAAAIVDYPAEDATRKWRHWRADKDQISKIEEVEKRLDIKERTHEALVAARLYGGSAIYINTRDRRQDKPLKIGAEIISLVVLTSNTLKRGDIVKDINSKYFGKAEFYSITDKDGKEQKIHASRLALFYGARMPADSSQFEFQQNWGRSVLASTLDAINNANTTMANVASLVFESKVDVFKFQGFAQLLAENGGDRKVFSRLHSQAAIKGINGAVVLDAQDEYEQKNASFASLSEIMREFKDEVAGAARIHTTRLYGRNATGLSNTGESDERIYYDRIEHEQTTEIGPALSLLDECIIIQALGSRPPDIFYEWAALRQISGKERADIFKTTADAARAIAGSSAGPLLPMDALSDAFANELTEQGVLPGLDQAITQYGSLSEQGLDEGGTYEYHDGENVTDALPRSLYVSRKVLNAKAILTHYEKQGLTNLVEPSDMHVTIMYSRTPVDWMKMGEAWDSEMAIPAGGARITEAFGENKDTLVLSFVSSNLSWRHEGMIQAGASWDWPEYQPHVSISYDFSGDADSVTPWLGEIKLGPEIFEAINNEA